MASKPLKSTVQEQEASGAVRAAMTTHRQQIIDGARELYQQVLLEGETMSWSKPTWRSASKRRKPLKQTSSSPNRRTRSGGI